MAQDIFKELKFDGLTDESRDYTRSGDSLIVTEKGQDVVKYSLSEELLLEREDNKPLGKTFYYSYDDLGNLIQVAEYDYTKVNSLRYVDPIKTIDFEYTCYRHTDRLTEYNKHNIGYDKKGNIYKYDGKILKFDENGNLIKISTGTGERAKTLVTYEYDEDDCRTKKICGDIITEYGLFYHKLTTTKQVIEIEYLHNTHALTGFIIICNGRQEKFFFKRDAFDSIIAITDPKGKEIVRYYYQASGAHEIYLRVGDNFVSEHNDKMRFEKDYINHLKIARINSYRFKSRLYDQDIKMYFYDDNYYKPEFYRYLKPSETEF